jgi:undecaprenyl-diphosphatase
MNWIDALILGLVQGLTEFLPVSSSGHLEIGKVLLGVDLQESLTFTVVVHGATVLSTIVVFFSEIVKLLKQSITFRYNDSTIYILKIIISMLPVLIVGILFKERISALFNGNLVFIGCMLIITSILLALTRFIKTEGKREIPYLDAFIIGIVQAIAVIPGISRSGSTIATGILLGNKREDVTKFSFLMALVPIIGANILDLMKGDLLNGNGPGSTALITGFIAAFCAGLFACKWMISLVKKGNLIYFSIYCLLLGLTAIIFA